MSDKKDTFHIELLQQSFNDFLKNDAAWKQNDKEWKEKATPILDLMSNLTFLSKAVIAVAAFIATVFSIVKFIFHWKP